MNTIRKTEIEGQNNIAWMKKGRETERKRSREEGVEGNRERWRRGQRRVDRLTETEGSNVEETLNESGRRKRGREEGSKRAAWREERMDEGLGRDRGRREQDRGSGHVDGEEGGSRGSWIVDAILLT